MNVLHRKRIFFLVVICFLFLVAGCQGNSSNSNRMEVNAPVESPTEEPSAEDKKDEENDNNGEDSELLETIKITPPIPETIADVVDYPIGPYAHINSTSDEVMDHLKTIPPMAEDASEDEMSQYVNYLYSLFKIDYQSPEALIESFEIMNAENPDEVADPELQKDQYNVIIALDASGSMGNFIGDKTMMEIAKEAITEYVESLPESANVGLRVYGHEGTGSDADKEISCKANELIYEIGPYNKGAFDATLNPVQPSGWTPLAEALLQSSEDLKNFSQENSRNIIYFVSDGIETCDGNPVEAAKKVKDSGIEPVVNIIGFGVSSEEGEQLKEIADAAGGNYSDAKNHSQLREEFSRSSEEVMKWQAWNTKSKLEIADNYNSNFFGVNDWENKWLLSNPESFLFMETAITNLNNASIISHDQMYWMLDVLKEKRLLQEGQVKELADKLYDLNKDNYDSMMNEVDEIYNTNKNNN